jgi:hypothetical protein
MDQPIKGFFAKFGRSLLWTVVLVAVSVFFLPPTAPAFVQDTYQKVFCAEGDEFTVTSSGLSRSAGFSFKCENSTGSLKDVTPLVLLVDAAAFGIVFLVIKVLLRARKYSMP